MDATNLTMTVDNRLAVVTINRPEKLNALNRETMAEIGRVFGTIGADPAIGAVILTGAGEKAFVAGADIGELAGLSAKSGEEFSLIGQKTFSMIENLGKPVIAAVNGYALGGGCELALACNIRIASDRAKFAQPEILLGCLPGFGGTQRLARLVGRGKATEMILTGATIDAGEALRIGLVNAVVPQDQLMKAAETMARTILGKSGIIVGRALEAINASVRMTAAEGEKTEARLFGECCGTKDFKEGTAAFLSKRQPVFRNE